MQDVPTVDEETEQISPAYRLLAAVLCGDNPDEVMASASEQTLKALVQCLEESGVTEEFDVTSIEDSYSRASMISYIEEFARKGTDQMRLRGSGDVMMDNEPRHNAKTNALHRAGLATTIDDGGNRTSHIRTQWQSNRVLYQGTTRTIGRPPPERAHWLSPRKFAEVNGRVNSRNIPPLMKVLIAIIEEKKGVSIDGKHYAPEDIIGLYALRAPFTYFINPIATDVILKKCGWAAPIPQERTHWIPLSRFVNEHLKINESAVNINKLSLLIQVFLNDDEALFVMDGEKYTARDLFGRYSKKGPSSYYINPIAKELIRGAGDWLPKLPENKLHWESSTQIAVTYYRSGGARVGDRIQQLNDLAVKLLACPDEKVNVGTTTEPVWEYPAEIVGRFRPTRGNAAYFFNPDRVDYRQSRLGTFRKLPSDKQHFIPANALAKAAKLPVRQADQIIRAIAQELRQKDEIDFVDPTSFCAHKVDPRSVIVETLHVQGHAPKIYIDPDIAMQYFSKVKILGRAATFVEASADTTSRTVYPLPIEKGFWISFCSIRTRMGIRALDALSETLDQYLHRLCEQGHPKVGYFAVRRGVSGPGTFFVDPEIVGSGRLISRQMLLTLRQTRDTQALQPTPKWNTNPDPR